MYLSILLGAAPADGGNQGSSMATLAMIVGLIVIFYFFMIRPQQKRQKKIRQEREAMKKGDKVVTAGGIYGTIKEVNETTFIIEVDRDVKIRVDRNSVYPSAVDANEAAQQNQDIKK